MKWQDFRNPHIDAEGNALFIPALRYLIARTFDRKYPRYRVREFVPLNTEVSPGATSIEWRSYDRVGLVKLISALADDLPYSDIRGEQNFSPIRSVGGAYRVSIDEVNAFLFEGKPLPAWKAKMVNENYESFVDRIGAYGDAESNLVGLLNIPNATAVTLANGATSSNKSWSGKTPQEKIDDVVQLISTVRQTTNGAEEPNTVLMPETLYTNISTERYGEVSEITTLEYMRRSFPDVTFDRWLRCTGAAGGSPGTNAGSGGNSGDRLVAYTKDSDHLELYIPKELAPLEPQQINLVTKVPYHGRIGGIVCYRPLSVAYADGA
jgi:hypothetical protein